MSLENVLKSSEKVPGSDTDEKNEGLRIMAFQRPEG